jgi:hypothetical protein
MRNAGHSHSQALKRMDVPSVPPIWSVFTTKYRPPDE